MLNVKVEQKIIPIYRKVVPKFIRDRIKPFLDKTILCPSPFLRFCLSCDKVCKKMFSDEVNYIKRKGLHVFPYSFSEKYENLEIEVYMDDILQMPYVMRNGKRLYYPRELGRDTVRKKYCELLREQDIASPHLYWDKTNKPKAGDVLLDIGAAEGFVSLDYIDIVDHIYTVECEPMWVEALNATFSANPEKITIIEKYCGDCVDDSMTTVDNILSGVKNQRIVIKMDVEGAELKVLDGCKETIRNNDMKFAVTTYHNQGDAKRIAKWMKERRFHYHFSKGVMLFPYSKQERPYFRKGILRASSTERR